jgi:hypothetical protein
MNRDHTFMWPLGTTAKQFHIRPLSYYLNA